MKRSLFILSCTKGLMFLSERKKEEGRFPAAWFHTLTSSWDVQSAGVQCRRTGTMAAERSVLAYVYHIVIYSCIIKLDVLLWCGRMVAGHGSLAHAVEGAGHVKTGASLHHGSGAGRDGAGCVTWRQKRRLTQTACSCHLHSRECSQEFVELKHKSASFTCRWTTSDQSDNLVEKSHK